MGKHRDWRDIREDYQSSGLSYARLAEKYGVSIVTLKKAAKREGWVKAPVKAVKAETRATTAAKKIPKAKDTAERTPREKPERVTDEEVREQMQSDKERFLRVVSRLMDKIEQSVELMPPEAVKELKSLSGALKDLSSIAGWQKDEDDLAEQRARIEKLRADTKAAQSGEEAAPVTVCFIDTEGAEI